MWIDLGQGSPAFMQSGCRNSGALEERTQPGSKADPAPAPTKTKFPDREGVPLILAGLRGCQKWEPAKIKALKLTI
jgi:hypothetical protein